MVEYIVAIDVTRVRFPADAIFRLGAQLGDIPRPPSSLDVVFRESMRILGRIGAWCRGVLRIVPSWVHATRAHTHTHAYTHHLELRIKRYVPLCAAARRTSQQPATRDKDQPNADVTHSAIKVRMDFKSERAGDKQQS